MAKFMQERTDYPCEEVPCPDCSRFCRLWRACFRASWQETVAPFQKLLKEEDKHERS